MNKQENENLTAEQIEILFHSNPLAMESALRISQEKKEAKIKAEKEQEKREKEMRAFMIESRKKHEAKILRWERQNAKRGTGIDKPAITRDPLEIAEVLTYFADRMRNDLVDALFIVYRGESAEYRRALAHSFQEDLTRLANQVIEKTIQRGEAEKDSMIEAGVRTGGGAE